MTACTEPGRRPHARIVAGLCAFSVAVAVSGCVTTAVEDDPVATAVPVVIDVPVAPTGTDRTLVEFYDSVLAQLHEDHQDRDQARLRSLVESYLRAGVPEWARQRLEGFRALAFGLQFELHAAQHTRLETASAVLIDGASDRSTTASASAPDSIGEAVDYLLVLPAPPDGPWYLGGRGDRDPVSFRFALVIREHFLDGSEKRIEDAEVVQLDVALELATESLRLPVRLDLGASEAVHREVQITVELLPGYLQVGEMRAPVRRTQLATGLARQWPKGHEAIRKAPLLTLQNAMKLGDRAHFKHVRLAAEFAPREQRTEVENALMEWVRIGRADQALVAMAALHAIEPQATASVGDRDAWLLWWESRR